MKICSLASGSSGNVVLVSSDSANLLVDAGIAGKKIIERLAEFGIYPNDISAILVTHEHTDHIRSVSMLSKKYNIPVYGTLGTFRNVSGGISGITNPVKPNSEFTVGDVTVRPFSISHDAADPVAYTFTDASTKIGMATDLGIFDEETVSNLLDSDLLYVEANHDVGMLEVGPYPFSLKMRIKSELGHLSNDACADLVVNLCNRSEKRIKHVILGHLSKENNFPDLAYATVDAELRLRVSDDKRPEVHVAPRDEPSFMADTE